MINQVPYTCRICGGNEFDKPRQIHGYGANPTKLVFGNIWNPFVQKTKIFGQACMRCGHVEFFVDPIELRQKAR